MRTVNRTKSALAMIHFEADFFTSFQLSLPLSTSDTNDGGDRDVRNQCKMSMKACLNVFKNMRLVEECRISIDSINSKLMFEFRCRLEMTKTHHVSMLEQETLQATFPTEHMPNVLTASHKLIEEIVGNFPVNEEELTLLAGATELVVRNYVESVTVDRRYMRSQMTIR